MSNFLFVAVLLIAFSVMDGVGKQKMQSVYLLGHHFEQYMFSCTTGMIAGLSQDRKSILFYNIPKQHFVGEVKLPLPGQLLKWSSDGDRLVIVHDSYMSVLQNGVLKTTPMPVVQSSTLVVVNELACVIPAFDWWVIVCMNTTTLQIKVCPYQIYPGALAFVDDVKQWVYAVDQDLKPQFMYKFNVLDGCLNFIEINPHFGKHLWFSNNGSRIFLDNGLTLTASSNPQTDMMAHGNFNSSHGTYSYKWFSQSEKDPYLIAGLRADMNDTVVYYSWPHLKPIVSKEIPILENTVQSSSEQVHICNGGNVYVFSTYTTPDHGDETGVAYMTVPSSTGKT